MASLLPATLDALTAAATAALPTVMVVDGPVASGDSMPDWLFIGATDVEDEPGASTTDGMDPESAIQWVTAEVLTIQCTIQCWTGDPDGNATALRSRAYSILNTLESLLQPGAGMAVLGLSGLESGRVSSTSYTPHTSDVLLVVTLILTARVSVVT